MKVSRVQTVKIHLECMIYQHSAVWAVHCTHLCKAVEVSSVFVREPLKSAHTSQKYLMPAQMPKIGQIASTFFLFLTVFTASCTV